MGGCWPRKARPSQALEPLVPWVRQSGNEIRHWPFYTLFIGIPFCFFSGFCICFLNHVAESCGLYFLSHCCRFSKMSCVVSLAFPLTLLDLAFWKAFLLMFSSLSSYSSRLSPWVRTLGVKGMRGKWFLCFIPILPSLGNTEFKMKMWSVTQELAHFQCQCLVFHVLL